MTETNAETTTDDLLVPLPPRPSTVEQAASALRAQIAAGRLAPGTRLREERIAESLAISRNTVREAFRILANERLVDHVAFRGAHVRRMGRADITAMYRTRRLLEPLGLQVAVDADTVRAVLRTAVESASAAVDRSDWQAVGTEDIAFHRALLDSCRSTHISAVTEQLMAELRLAFLLVPDPEALHKPYVARNRRILDLLDAGDEATAAAELDDYLVTSETDVLRAITASGVSP